MSESKAWWVTSDPDHPANPDRAPEPEPAPIVVAATPEPEPGPMIGTQRSTDGRREVFTAVGWLPLTPQNPPHPIAPPT